jgi:GT2 family glycosyltransferase
LVLLLTQDAIPKSPDFIQTLVHTQQKHQAAGVYARQEPYPDASPLVKKSLEQWVSGSKEPRVSSLSNPEAFFALPPAQQHLFCVFENVAGMVQRAVWEKIPFPETPFGEDLEWGYRVLCNGYKIAYEPKAVVIHSHERPPAYTYQRTFIDHYKLYELFGLRTIPTFPKVLRSFILTSLSNWAYLLSRPSGTMQWAADVLNVPRHAWNSALGQYRGAKAAAQGIPIEKIPGV